jgi:hypothetical protein
MCSKRKADEFFDRENAKHNRRINDFYQTSHPEDSANEIRDDSKENHSDLENRDQPWGGPDPPIPASLNGFRRRRTSKIFDILTKIVWLAKQSRIRIID